MATTGPRLNPLKTTTNYDASTISPTHNLNSHDPSNPNSNSTSSHKRVYQACIPCRRRKVRCDLGSVDEPHDPPCQRCRRESKECYFSATRRKRRPTDDGRDESIDQDDFEDDYDARNRRKRIRSSSEKDDLHAPTHQHTGGHHSRADIPPPIMANGDSLNSGAQPLTPGGSQSRAQPLRRPTSASHESFTPITSQRQDSQPSSGITSYLTHPAVSNTIKKRTAADSAASGDDDQHLTNRLWETEVYNGHDALNLLFEAAGRSGDMDDHQPIQGVLRDSNSQSSVHNSPVLISGTPGRAAAASVIKPSAVRALPRGDSQQSMMEKPGFGGSNRPSTADRSAPLIDPAVRAYEHEYEGSTGDMEGPGFQDALKAWFRLRFVRAGWFTAREAIEYVNYFYTFMAPLTPVIPPTFRSPSTHSTLLSEEPILTVTILTIASRYKYLPGPGGRSRSYAIHEKLWTYLRGMIERMVWGQEQFGGNSANVPSASQNGIDGRSDGEDKTSSTAPWRGLKRGSLRTLGTVESLMLLTEWHPRALHFPPGDDGDELIVKDEPFMPDFGFDAGMGATPTTMNGMDPVPRYPAAGGKGIGGKRIESWLEPAWRSDRMCWMLLGNALALAFELGVFDSATSEAAAAHDVETQRPDRGSLSYRLRASRVHKLLYVYITQLAGRLEWTPMVANLASLKHMNHRFDSPESPVMFNTAAYQQKRRRATSRASSSSEPQLQLHQIDSIDETILDCWIGITDLMKSGNQHLFPSRTVTRDLIRTGKYVELLESFQPRIRRWLSTFGGLNMPDYIRYILRIEFEYVRVYINSLALQAVIERCTSTNRNTTFPSAFSTVESSNRASSVSHQAAIQRDRHPSIAFAHLMAVQDQSYIAEVVDASRNLLRTVVEGLLPGDYLKHCPVRTYFRIISGAMFLLKTFALGAKEEDVAISLSLMDHTVNALRTCVVDDVHLGIRFAELLEVLTRRIRSRFVRMAGSKGDRSGSGRATPQNISATTPGLHGVAEHRGDVHQPTHAPQRGGHATAPIERSNEHPHSQRHSNYHHHTTANAPVSGSSTSNHREPSRENNNGWSYRHEPQHNHGSHHQAAHQQHNHHHTTSSPDRHRQHHSQSHQRHPTIPSDPLFGISTTPLHPDDQGHVSVSIMPPPSYPFSAGFIPAGGAPSLDANTSSYNNGPADADDDDEFAAYPADWLGLDLNPLLNYGSQANGNSTNSGTGVDGSTPGSGHLGSSTPGQHAPLDTGGGSAGMGGYGMGMGMGMYSGMGGGGSVGGFDLLEVLLNDMEGTSVAPGGRSHAHGQAQA